MTDAAGRTLEGMMGRTARELVLPGGETLSVPEGWELLEPGDAGLTRKLKAGGPSWTIKEKRGRRVFSLGVWAPAGRIEAARAAVEAQRASPAYQRKLAAGRARRAKHEEAYGASFREAIVVFLDFAPAFAELAERLAEAVAAHAVPVGSGTVARTQRIPIEERAELAVIAWMRHQTTGYDGMAIARVKGRRRAVRRRLAERSRALLAGYRAGTPAADCPLAAALDREGDRGQD